MGLPFLAAALIQMIREDEQEAAQVDAELDTRAQAAVPGTGEAGIVPPGAGEPGVVPPATPDGKPWWESDPRFTGRFQRPGGE